MVYLPYTGRWDRDADEERKDVHSITRSYRVRDVRVYDDNRGKKKNPVS